MTSDFFIMVMAVLEFTLTQFNSRSLKSNVYNPNFFRIFKVFKSLRALRAIRILKRLRSAGPQQPSLEEGTAAWTPGTCAVTCCRNGGRGLQTPAHFWQASCRSILFTFQKGAGTLPSH